LEESMARPATPNLGLDKSLPSDPERTSGIAETWGPVMDSNLDKIDAAVAALSGGGLKWSDLRNATAPLALNNGINGTQIGTSIPAGFILYNTTSATGSGNQASPYLILRGQYFDGATSQPDQFTMQDVLAGSGASAASTLQIVHSGSPGGSSQKNIVSLVGDSTASLILETHNVFGQGMYSYVHSDTYWQGPYVGFYRSRGTQSGPTSAQSGDYLGTLGFGGYAGGASPSYVISCFIQCLSTDNWTSGGPYGGQLVFTISRTGTIGFDEVCRMRTSGLTSGAQSLSISPGATLSFFTGTAASDVGLSRVSAGVLGVGNGVLAGDVTGTLQCSKILGSGNMRGSVSSVSGTTVSVTFPNAYGSTPTIVVTPTTNCGTFYISAQSASGFTITYSTSGVQSFNWIAIG